MKLSKNNPKRMRKNAMALAEVAAGATLAVIFILLVVDAVVLLYAAFMNDLACRDAARAASKSQLQNPPANATASQISPLAAQAALYAAQQSLYSHRVNSNFVSNPALFPANNINYHDNIQGTSPNIFTSPVPPPAASNIPYVSVTTMVNVKLPMPVNFFGSVMLQGGAQNTITFYRSYTFPLNNLNPGTTP